MSWLVFAANGCSPDFNRLSAGTGGAAGAHTTGGGAGTGGASASGGASGTQQGGTAGSTAGSAGFTAGSAGSPAGSGGDAGIAGVAGGGTGGEAGAMCTAGTTNCPGQTGCTDLDVGDPDNTSVINCGSCGVACSVSNASGADCSAGTCKPTCKTGFGDCNAQAANDGCEVDITTLDNCGKCGYPCSHTGATSVACTFGKCVPTCASYLGNCNAMGALTTDDGCEAYLESLTQCRPDCNTAGVACGPLQTCTLGACGAAQGLAVLTVPFSATEKDQRYADLFAPPLDLTNTQFVVRIYAPGATSGQIIFYFSDSITSAAGGGATVPLTDYAAGWKELLLNVGPATTSFNAASIKQLTIEVVSGATAWTPDPMVVYIDAIRSTNALVNDTFDASAIAPPMFISGNTKVTGATLTWANALP